MHFYKGENKAIAVICISFLAWMSSFSCQAQFMSRPSQLPTIPFLIRPAYAQFISSSLILRGDSKGLSIWDTEKGQTDQYFLQDNQITAMLADPHKEGRVIIATETGDVFLGIYADGKLMLRRQEAFDKTTMGYIKTILFHFSDSEKLLVADQKTIALCRMNESEILIEKIVSFEPFEDLIVFAFPDHLSNDYFMISGTRESRFRGKWSTGEVVNVEEKKLEYGYSVAKRGISYFARGDNDEYLNIRFITARATSIIKHPTLTNVFYASTIGISPLKFTVSANNHYNVEYLAENTFLTFSIDIDRNNPQNILFTTEKSIRYSNDGGTNWRDL